MKLPLPLRALSHANFRLFFAGQSISLIGTWMQQIALSWLVFQMTGSSYELSLVLFFGQLPSLFLSPIAGVLIDRWPRHLLLQLTQGLALIQATLLAWLTLTGRLEVWMIWPLSLFLGIITAFDITARQAFLPEMVTRREDLGNAIALNSSMVNATYLIGPALAAMVLAHTSAGVCFALNAVSYLAVLLSLRLMRVEKKQSRMQTALFKSLHEGMRYVTGFVPVRVILIALSLSSLAGASYKVLLPEFSVHVLHGGATTLSELNVAVGLGALVSTAFLATRKTVVGLGHWIYRGSFLMGGGLIIFAYAKSLPLTLLALACVGFGMMMQMASSNTLLQTISDPDKRARVMSFYTVAFLGMAPLGSLLSGLLTQHFGYAMTLQFSGGACIVSAIAVLLMLPRLRAEMHPIYQRLNLMPLAEGIQSASELRLATKE